MVGRPEYLYIAVAGTVVRICRVPAQQLRHPLVQGPAELHHGAQYAGSVVAEAELAAAAIRRYRLHPAETTTPPGRNPRAPLLMRGIGLSAVNGTAVIADGPSRGACSVTTPSRHPAATTGAPDIPDHSDAPSAIS